MCRRQRLARRRRIKSEEALHRGGADFGRFDHDLHCAKTGRSRLDGVDEELSDAMGSAHLAISFKVALGRKQRLPERPRGSVTTLLSMALALSLKRKFIDDKNVVLSSE